MLPFCVKKYQENEVSWNISIHVMKILAFEFEFDLETINYENYILFLNHIREYFILIVYI